MFRYLLKFRLISAGLLLVLGTSFYFHPAYGWMALFALVFLRLTKLHSYLVIADLADRVATKHIRVLATKRAHMLAPDEYGHINEESWDKHLNLFIKKMLLPEFQKQKVDHLLTADPKRHLQRLRKRINRIIGRYEPLGQRHDDEEDTLTGREYEVYCKRLLEQAEWSVALTPGSGDQGADLIAEKSGLRIAIQCKFYSGSVGNKAVQEAYAAARFQDADCAVVVTNSIFTKSARQLANKNGVLLMHHDDLSSLENTLAGHDSGCDPIQ
jgi:restriction system protein